MNYRKDILKYAPEYESLTRAPNFKRLLHSVLGIGSEIGEI